jgi:hypothetical protein
MKPTDQSYSLRTLNRDGSPVLVARAGEIIAEFPNQAAAQRWIDRVDRAVAIIGHPACRDDVEQAVESIADWRTLAIRSSKKGKAAARDLARALQRVHAALRNKHLFPGLADSLTEERVVGWINDCDAIAGRPLRDAKERWTGKAERRAAEQAYELMRRYGKPATITKGSQFEQLAAVLYGDAGADLHHYCRAVVRSAKSQNSPVFTLRLIICEALVLTL